MSVESHSLTGAPAPGRIRVLTPDDETAFVDHLLRLDTASRRDRFNGITDDAFLRDYARRCFTGKTVVFGYVEGPTVQAAAELHHLGGVTQGEGEIAFSVERGLQHKGVGSLLFEHLIALARHLGYARLCVTTHSGNEAMKALARKFNAKLSFQHFETVGVIDISDAKPSMRSTAPANGVFGMLGEIARSLSGRVAGPKKRDGKT